MEQPKCRVSHKETGNESGLYQFWKAIVLGTTDQRLIVPSGSQGARVIG